MRRRGGRRWRVLCGLVLSLVLAPGRVGAAEPDGAVALRYAWDADGRIRLDLKPVVPLDEVVVTWTGAHGTSLRAVRPDGAARELAAEATPGGERLAVGRLEAGAARSFLLEVTGEGAASPAGNAVVRVEGRLRGRPFQESVGIPLARRDPGRLRLDAVEFDASPGSSP